MYKLQINDTQQNIKFAVKYQNLAKLKRPEIESRAPDGSIVKERSMFQGQVLAPGSTQRKFVDANGNVHPKQSLKFYYNGEEVIENSQTKVFNVEGYQPESAYTDQYVISSYYELLAHNDDMKKDFDKEKARIGNLHGMKKMWDYLHDNKLCARGEFCASSKGFIASDGYLRAIEFGNKWTLELGIFREEKIFEYLQETIPAIPTAPQQQGKRIRMI